VIIVIKVPVVWEVTPQWGFVVFSLSTMLFLSLVGFGLVLKDLGDVSVVGFGGDEDGGQL